MSILLGKIDPTFAALIYINSENAIESSLAPVERCDR